MESINIAAIVLYHRKRAGLSREECAALAGVGKTVVYDLEHGKTSIRFDTLLKILYVLNIKLDFQSPLMQEYKHEKSEYIHS